MIGFTQSLSERLLKTGWQSWSYEPYGSKPFLEIPQCIYSPKKYEVIPNIDWVGKEHKKPITGWCSWYSYGWDINSERILRNAVWMSQNKQIPLEYVLIDAGWANAGDWFQEWKSKFPKGLKGLVSEINSLGLQAGIWIAPFMVDPWSDLAKKHPDWLVKSEGKFVDGFRLTQWDKFLPFKKWIINMKNEEAKKYIHSSIERLVEDVGVTLLKMDFLYSIYFDPNITIDEADQIIKDFLSEIKNKYPNLYTIGCGCPLVPAVGLVDSMRIGPDTVVSPFVKFLPLSGIFDSLFMHNRVIKTLHNRMWTKDLWNIDPDAFVCRPDIGLSESQILFSLETIKKTGGNIFVGDKLDELSQDRIEKYIIPLFNKD